MKLCQVVGTVWGTKEARMLDGAKLVQLRPLTMASDCQEINRENRCQPALSSELILAVDTLGAGVGEFVILGQGSRLRDLTLGPAVPTKAVVLAIVDGASWLSSVNNGEGK